MVPPLAMQIQHLVGVLMNMRKKAWWLQADQQLSVDGSLKPVCLRLFHRYSMHFIFVLLFIIRSSNDGGDNNYTQWPELVLILLLELMVAGSTLLAGLSAGGVVGFPGVLLQQFKLNDTIIHLDLHKGSWIGSVHGFAGLVSTLMPLFMQYRGRKLAFMLSCNFIIIGWVLIYIAQDITTLLIGECFHGVGGNSLLTVSLLTISEIVEPKYRNTCLSLYGTVQAFGIAIVGIIGQYLHWKTVGLIMCSPILVVIPISCIWPESPAWLAWKGRLEECKKSFNQLRGTDEEYQRELKAIIDSKQESNTKLFTKEGLQDFGTMIKRKDFYVPSFHTMVLLNVLYWGGGIPVIIYSNDMFIKASGKHNTEVELLMYVSLFVGYCSSSFLVRYFSARKLMLLLICVSCVFITSASVITFMQSVNRLAKDSELAVYCLAIFFLLMCAGPNSIGFCIASEIMPVKYRGIVGCLFVICTCVFHSTSLKAYPYLSLYINIWGVFLIYSVYLFVSAMIIWRYVPETKNRTLQEIEEYYNVGYFKKVDKDDGVHVPFIMSEIK